MSCSLSRQHFPVYLAECHRDLETGTVLFSIFTRFFKEVIKSTFLRFADDTKLEGTMNVL